MYKNYTRKLGVPKWRAQNLGLIMRLSVVILITTFMQVSAAGFSQKVSISKSNAPLRTILGDIKKQTGYNFIITERLLKTANPVTIHVNGVELEEILDRIFNLQSLNFQIESNTVIITKKKPSILDLLADRWANIDVRGIVVDERGLPLPGATITVKGTGKKAISDVKGEFHLKNVDENAVLVISYLGYANKEVQVATDMRTIKLSPIEGNLDDVVISGFGIKQAKKDLTGASSQISGKDISTIPIQSFDNALAGRAAGVQVTSSSGLPGAAVSVNVRGISSITAGTQPLYIVDGVQVISGDNSRQFASSNALAGINPDDIETISILKDAASASIYGAQAANGVVVITTKRGKTGKTQVNFNPSIGFSNIIKKAPILNSAEFIQLSKEAIINRYGSLTVPTAADAAKLLASFGDPATAPTYDWQDAVFRTGITQNYILNATGGNETTKFFVSGAYNKQIGQEIGQDFNRATARVNLDHKISKKFSFETSLNLSSFTQNGTSGGTAFSSPNRTAILMPPINPIYNPDGTYNTLLYGAYPNNVVQTTDYNIQRANTKAVVGNIVLNYQILKDLKFRSSFSENYSYIAENSYTDPRTPDGASVNGSASVANTTFADFNTDQTLNYSHVFNQKHNLNAVAGFSYKQEVNDGNNASGTGFPSYQFKTLQSSAVKTVANSFYTAYKLAGYFARVDYSFNEKYLASATVRRDGSSRFGSNKRYGTFPAASLGWRLSKEDFLSQVTWIDELKLRGSYGILGNSSIGNFASRSLYQGLGSYNGQPGINPSLGNNDLSWEQAATTDVGVDFSFFKGRLSGGVGAFRKKTTDLLLARNLPITSGYAGINTNIGKLKNEGIEIELNTVNLKTKDFEWSTTLNATFIRSKLLELNDGLQQLNFTYFVGKPLLSYFVVEYAGVNPADGNPMYYDINGNITYSPTAADRKIVGSQLPKGYGGLTNTFKYKAFTLTTFIQYQYGSKINNVDGQFNRRMGSTIDRNQDRSELRRWQRPGDITDTPRPYYNTGVPAAAQSGGITYLSPYGATSRFIEDGSYVRLKNVNLSYRLPASWLGTSIRSLQIYAQAYNLVTLTKFTGIDPEVQGSSSGIVPQYKNYTFGVQLGL
ncbi:TonB-dependent receptor [Pedobacter gandavensis]|uniref:TonB-dependent receptor n=1 Tax=Pedobacter gandavensis TaxID=2679963 RepID=UPI002931734E|nr:TonB-dependent receptor [Pedobacter gandavensis]